MRVLIDIREGELQRDLTRGETLTLHAIFCLDDTVDRLLEEEARPAVEPPKQASGSRRAPCTTCGGWVDRRKGIIVEGFGTVATVPDPCPDCTPTPGTGCPPALRESIQEQLDHDVARARNA